MTSPDWSDTGPIAQLRDWADDLSSQVARYRWPTEAESPHQPSKLWRVMVPIAGVVLLVGSLFALSNLPGGDQEVPPASGSVITTAQLDDTTDLANATLAATTMAETPATTASEVIEDVFVNMPLTAGAWGGARTDTTGVSLELFFVGAPEYEPGQPCTMRYIPVVEETDEAVKVLVHGEHPGKRPQHRDGRGLRRLHPVRGRPGCRGRGCGSGPCPTWGTLP